MSKHKQQRQQLNLKHWAKYLHHKTTLTLIKLNNHNKHNNKQPKQPQTTNTTKK